MKAPKVLWATGLFIFAVSAAHAEECQVLSKSESGESQITPFILDLNSQGPLDSTALPENVSAVMCPRASIVPLANDVRVLTEWRVAFGVAEEGPRALWIWSRGGRLQTTIDNGELDVAERASVDDWLKAAQVRFDASRR